MNRLTIAAVVLAATVSVAFATPFPIENTGGTFSYTANVAYRLGPWTGSLMGSATGTTDSAVQAGVPSNIINFNFSSWQLGSDFDGTKTASMKVTLDQTYDLNKIDTQYVFFRPTTFDLAVSTDDIFYTPIVTAAAVTADRMVNTFAITSAKYIQWTVHGPGANLGGGAFYTYPAELLAFTDSTSPNVPQLEQGYNVIPGGTVVASSGDDLSPALDEIFFDFATPNSVGGGSKTIDLGAIMPVGLLKVGFFPSQQWNSGAVEFSKDGVNFTNVLNLGGPIGDLDFPVPFAQQRTRFIRISGQGGGALIELGAFVIPEPTTLALLPLGLAAIAGRRTKR